MKRVLPLVLLAALLLTGCAQQEETRQVFAMDTVMELRTGGSRAADAADAAEQELYRLDALLSRTRADSAVYELNDSGAADAGEEVCALLADALDYADATGGAFDVTIAPVVSGWGFTTDSHQVPDQTELEALLACVGSEHVTIDGTAITLDPGTGVDLGGIAKGYASDRVGDIYREFGLSRGLIVLGGNILAFGEKADGQPWTIGVQDPADPAGYAGILSLTDQFAVTSGGYQRYFEQDGKIYHHIIDPADGYPADSGLTSVTIVADNISGNGTLCDALSTALFVMGEEEAVDFWRSGVYDFDMVLVTEDGRVVVSAGIADSFTPEGGYAYETVS